MKKQFLPFPKARQIARKLGLRSSTAWFKFCSAGNRPDGLPFRPDLRYKDLWQGWSDFLGYRPDFLPYAEAKRLVAQMGLQSAQEWFGLDKTTLPEGVPSAPFEAYRDSGWESWADFLGYTNRHKRIPFTEAREIARGLNLKTSTEWMTYWAKHKDSLPNRFPARPDRAYRDKGWRGWADFLGHDNSSRQRAA